jgi:leucyl aminopeptidase
LKEFVGDTPWAHLDIAGPMRADADEGWLSKGATAFGVRTFVELLERYAAPIPARS